VESKVWWHSKQIWVAIIAAVATAYQAKFGFIVSPEIQGYALTVIMVILRAVTKEPVSLTKPEE
jgi:hypothetical protein